MHDPLLLLNSGALIDYNTTFIRLLLTLYLIRQAAALNSNYANLHLVSTITKKVNAKYVILSIDYGYCINQNGFLTRYLSIYDEPVMIKE